MLPGHSISVECVVAPKANTRLFLERAIESHPSPFAYPILFQYELRLVLGMAKRVDPGGRSQEVRSQDQHPHSESRRLILQLLSAAAAPGRPFSDVQQGLNPRSEPYLSSHHLGS